MSKHTFYIQCFPQNCAVYETIPMNMVEPEGPQMTQYDVALCISKATRAHARAHAHAP
jgi:hypothetical protein